MPPVTRSSYSEQHRQRRRDRNSRPSRKRSHTTSEERTKTAADRRRLCRWESALADSTTASSSSSSSSSDPQVSSAGTVVRRRRSGRQSNGLRDLAQLLVAGKTTVFITGAGLSVGSGIRPFRDSSAAMLPRKKRTSLKPASASNAIWNAVIWTTATREAFRKNPLDWYNQFWIPQFLLQDDDQHQHQHQNLPPITTTNTNNTDNNHQQPPPHQQLLPTRVPQPNPGHVALYQLQHMATTHIELITQNVDGLHIQVEQNAKEERERCCQRDNKGISSTTTTNRGENENLEHSHVRPPAVTSTTTATSSSTSTTRTTPWSSHVIEAHGRLGLYKCLPDSDSDTDDDSDDDPDRSVHLGHRRKTRALRQAYLEQQKQQKQHPSSSLWNPPSNNLDTCDSNNTQNVASHQKKKQPKHRRDFCQYQFLESLTVDQLEPPRVRSVLKDPSHNNMALLSTPPTCPSCGRLCLPQALLFDEGYHSHCFYQFEQIERVLEAAQVMVFVGTSFSVTLTQVALRHAKQHKIPVYNINPLDLLHPTSHVHNICGKAEDILPQLVELCHQGEEEQEEEEEEVKSLNNKNEGAHTLMTLQFSKRWYPY